MDRDRVAGSVRKLGGKVEKAAGELTGDEELEARGFVDEAAGTVQNAIGRTKDVARDYIDQADEYVGSARDAAGRFVARGKRYVDEGFDGLPDPGEAFERGRTVVGREIQDNPLAALMIAGAVGYGLALLIHGRRSEPPAPPARRRARPSRG
jgi:uncharacterized protein YjbJ (UPF0337 family)